MRKVINEFLFGMVLLALFTTSCQNKTDATEKNIVIYKLPYKQRWVYDATEVVHTIIASNNLIIGATTQKIFALSKEDGTIIWKVEFKTPDTYTTNLSIANNILVVSNNRELLALDILTGTTLWKKTIEVDGSNILDVSPKNIVLEVLPSWGIQVYDILSGDFLWETGGARGGSSAFVTEVDKSTLIIAGDGMEGFEIDTGEKIWSNSIIASTTSALKSNIFASVASNAKSDNLLFAYNLDTENILWNIGMSPKKYSMSIYRIFFVGERLILATSQGLIGINYVDGSVLWETQVDTGFDNVIPVDRSLISRARNENTVYAFDSDSGKMQGYISFESKGISFLANSDLAVTLDKSIAVPVDNKIYFFTVMP